MALEINYAAYYLQKISCHLFSNDFYSMLYIWKRFFFRKFNNH